MALLNAQDIFGADDSKTETVKVPEWGGEILIKTLTAQERDAFEAESVTTNKSGRKEQDLRNFRARYVSKIAINEDGSPLFKTRQEIAMLGSKSARALDRVFEAGTKLNLMTEEDIEELTEGFEEGADGDSTSV